MPSVLTWLLDPATREAVAAASHGARTAEERSAFDEILQHWLP